MLLFPSAQAQETDGRNMFSAELKFVTVDDRVRSKRTDELLNYLVNISQLSTREVQCWFKTVS